MAMNEWRRKYENEHNKEIRVQKRKWRLEHREWINKYKREYNRKHKGFSAERSRRYRAKYPWAAKLFQIRGRCENKRSVNYSHYGERGIKCLLTMDDIKMLWFRDKAYLMKIPSIHRINNNGNYEVSNCKFIEMEENAMEMHIRRRFVVDCYDLGGEFSGKFQSVISASRILHIPHNQISAVLHDRQQSARGFVFKRAEEK